MFYILFCLFILAAVIAACTESYLITAIGYVGAIAIAYFTIQGFHELVQFYGWWTIGTVFIPIYIGIGVAVAFMKWILFMREFGGFIKGIADKEKGNDDLNIKQFVNCVEGTYGYSRFIDSTQCDKAKRAKTKEEMVEALAPIALEHKGRLSAWILEWPFVLLATFIRNFILELVDNIISLFGNVFTRIGKYFVRSATKDLHL